MIDFPATQSSVHIKTKILYKKEVHDGQEVWEVRHNLFAYRATVHISTSETHWSCSEGLFQSILDNFLTSLDPRTAYPAAHFNTVLFNTLPLSPYCVKSYEKRQGEHGKPGRVLSSWSWEDDGRDHQQTFE